MSETALRLDDAQEMLDRQTEVLELIARATPLPEVLTTLLAALERLMPGAACSVLLLDRQRGTLHHGAAPALPADYVAAIDGMRIGDGAGSCGTAAALGTPVIAVDVRTDPRWTAYRMVAQAAGLRSCWSTPIRGRDGGIVGTFAVYHGDPHSPSAREELLVQRFTHLASVAIDHASLVGALIESEERFRRSFDANSLGMAILDAGRTITTANAALATLAGGLGEVLGRRLADLVTPTKGTLDDLLAPLAAAGADPDSAPVVVFEGLLLAAGMPRPQVEVEVTVSRLTTHDGTNTQDIVNVFDLTERRAAEQHLHARLEAETARRIAEQHSRAKSELLAALGHEVRTPIQAIVGFAELLGTMELDEGRRRKALTHIDAAAGHVMELLSDVLDLSRLESGALPLALEPVPVAEVVTKVFDMLSTAADLRDVELVHDSVHPEVVLADRRRLRQVLLNLVGNAIRHGGGRVEVRSHPSDDPAYAVLSVDDEGPGIPPDVLPHLFTAYARHAPTARPQVSSTAAATPGAELVDENLGLGLSLTHGLMAAMHGELSVGHTSPAGTSMVLRIPLAAPGASA
jgi:signal transduction histidine kinase